MTRTPAVSRFAAAATSIPVLAALIALVTWPGYSIAPQQGLDPSWMTGIALASQRGFDYGTEIVFTYGPLGFLFAPSTVSAAHAVLAGLFLVAMRVALAATVLWAAGRSFPLPVAFVIALVTSALVQQDELVIIAFAVAAVALSDDPPDFVRPLLVYGGGLMSAVGVLGKLSFGVIVLALCFVGVAGLDARRLANLARLACTFVASLLVLWLVTGQPLAALPDYVRHSNEVVSGFASAMMLEDPPAAWDRVFMAVAVAAAFAAVAIVSWSWPLTRRIGALALVAVLAFTAFKQGFVRHDDVHMRILVPALLAPWVAFVWRGGMRAAAAAAIAAIAIAYFPVAGESLGDIADPLDRAEAARDDVGSLLIASERRDVLDAARERTAHQYDVDDATLEAVGDAEVAVYPWETTLAWTYDLNWRPLPVFQSYTAYTRELDELNAESLRSAEGPERLLRHVQSSVDGRYGPYEAPATTLAMLCNFEALHTTAEYQVLGRVPDRCGEPRTLESVEAPYGQSVEVPEAPANDEAVIAVVEGLGPSSRERLRTALYRGLIRTVVFDDYVPWRLIPDTADGVPLLVSAPRGVDFPRPFQLAPDLRQLLLKIESGFANVADPLTIEFQALPVKRAPATARGGDGG